MSVLPSLAHAPGFAAFALAVLVAALARIHLNKPGRFAVGGLDDVLATTTAFLATGLVALGLALLGRDAYATRDIDPWMAVWALGLAVASWAGWRALRLIWSWPIDERPEVAADAGFGPPPAPRPRQAPEGRPAGRKSGRAPRKAA